WDEETNPEERRPRLTGLSADSREVREFFITLAAQAKAATKHLRDPGILQIILIHPLTENVGTIYRYALDDPQLIEPIHGRPLLPAKAAITSTSRASRCGAISVPRRAAHSKIRSPCSRWSSTATMTRAKHGCRQRR